MSYEPNIWVDRVGTTRYFETVDDDGALIFTPDYTQVTEMGTPVNADNMNHIEEGIAAGSFTKYNNGKIYKKNDLVTLFIDDKPFVAISKKNENQGNNPVNDTVNWRLFEIGGSSSGAFLGQTIFSLDPLSDSALHLLDGTTLTVGGVFDSFITDYIESLYSSNPERFTTEELWQESVSNYGVCAKYVYTQGVSVRLPKITGFIEGTLDPAALGEIVEAGLPNISQTFTAPGNQNLDDSTLVNITLGGQSVSSYPPLNSTSKENSTWDIDFSRANPIYGNSTTVQPQSIKGYFYIVVATGTKTQTQIDIDNITTDLNTKADTDLTNTTPAQSFKNESMLWTTPDFANIITMNMTTTQSEFVAPSHGWIIWALCGSKGITGDVYVNGICVGGGGGEASSTPALSTLSFSGICPVAKDDVVKYRSTRATMPDYPEYYYFKFVPMKGVQE